MTRHLWSTLVLVSLMCAPGLSAAQPLLEMDPCGYASFPDDVRYKEYEALASRLARSGIHVGLLEEWRRVGRAMHERMSTELIVLWSETHRAVQNAVRSPMLDDVQAVLMDRCLNRIRRTPEKETDVVRRDIELMRSLLSLSDTDFDRQFRARMKMTRDALGSPHAAGDTLRANLGIPTPNWFVHTPRALSCASSAEHLAGCYPSREAPPNVVRSPD